MAPGKRFQTFAPGATLLRRWLCESSPPRLLWTTMLDLVVSAHAELVADAAGGFLGLPPGRPRQRWVYAVPLEDGPQQLRGAFLIIDAQGAVLGDPAGGFVGLPRLIVSRLLPAASTWQGG